MYETNMVKSEVKQVTNPIKQEMRGKHIGVVR